MRMLVFAPLLAACAAAPSAAPDAAAYTSVRDRLAAAPTRLFIAATPAAGSLAAEHNAGSDWQGGTAPLAIANGAFVAALDGSGALVTTSFQLAFEPIDVPASVLGTPVELSNVRLALAAPVTAPVTWTDDDHATATIALALQLSWSLAIDGNMTPLGAQELPPIPLALSLGGDGDEVTASLALHGTGELWSWADLLKLTALDVSAQAATVDD